MNLSNASNISFRNLPLVNGVSNTTGEQCLGFSILNVSLLPSINCICEIQFGPLSLGTFTTFYKLELNSNSEKYNACSIRGRYVRFKFTNSTGSDGTITSNSILTMDSGGTNIHNSNIVKSDYSSVLTREHSDLMSDMINREYEGILVKDLNGIVSGVTNTNKRNFWNLDNKEDPVLSTNNTLFVVSDSNDDRSGQIGARTITFEYVYLDADGNLARGLASGLVNGITPQSLAVTGIAITHVEVTSVGSNGSNVGNLTFSARIGVAPAVYQTLNYMPIDLNMSKFFIGVPIKNENLIIKEINYGGTSQIIGKIRITKVTRSSNIRKVLLEEVVDGNNHYSKVECSIRIEGEIEYLIGEFLSTTTPPVGSVNHFHLTARGIFKDMSNST